MAIRLQEIHPSLVHLPISLLPVAISADALGRATGSRSLLETGRQTIQVAAAGAAVSAVSGLIAQEEVNVQGETMDMLITHRNINLAATVLTGLMAVWRRGRYRPSVAYLGVGFAGIAALIYSAYLGGTLVYKHGVGVEPAGGQYRKNPPEFGVAGETGAFVRGAATDLVHGVKHLVQELAQGKIVPWLADGRAARRIEAPQRAERAAPEHTESAATT
ncbi:MAG TPA: DUF2231 domain-containing protein [Gemmatimonadales bacterium]|nr:DUF2231 domain-containing protein [Gemmatimonadales bacterium]